MQQKLVTKFCTRTSIFLKCYEGNFTYFYSCLLTATYLFLREGYEAFIASIKEFESARRTLSGIEIVRMIKKNQLIGQDKTMFKSFMSLAA